ncbi:T9SS type A sorting domain-containing protein [Kaistella sp. G5-32]|uniref:T9SS type A sorting domain-containing protein n=1 Tax=Kaistella gelatinilytica TaxID=2787636 RepID=A0ABS0FAP3_9FLAO|nr:T9SS type A sorting domain-containing protein [Kaistella gelatinilytica]MBF8456779.1 T9SS type A sorting domain-containing protein [Kaistella gelatinilytica]
MRKLYSLFAIAMFSVAAVAQTTLLSDDFASASTGDNTTTGGSGIAWTGDANFPDAGNVKVYQAGGAVKIGTGSLVGSITSKTLDLSQDGGAFKVSFDVKGWTAVEGDITVTVSGLAAQTVTYVATRTDSFETKTLTFTGGTAGSTVTIATTAKRAFIDNVKVITSPVVLAVGDVNATKANLVKNTVVGNSIIFASKANVQVVNMNGQVVRTSSVNENSKMDVSTLTKGTYIVTGNVNGKAVSQKIIKK